MQISKINVKHNQGTFSITLHYRPHRRGIIYLVVFACPSINLFKLTVSLFQVECAFHVHFTLYIWHGVVDIWARLAEC